MNIVSTQYNLENKALEIYLSGCNGNPKCEGCHNTELWDFDTGTRWERKLPHIINKVNESNEMIDNIWILGGEPLDQEYVELLAFIDSLYSLQKDLWLFTRYDLKDINLNLLDYFKYVKTGKFEQNLMTDDNIQYGVKLASLNQNILKIK